MNEYIEALQELAKQLKSFVDKRIKRAKFDKTVQGRITELLPKNKCKVLIDGKEFSVRTKASHSVNEVVDICVPQNNKNMMYVVPNGTSGGSITGDTKDCTVTFTEVSTDADVVSGDKHSTIVGKFVKSIKTFRDEIGILATLKTDSKSNLVSSINEIKDMSDSAFQSASNGKALIKNAVTGKDDDIIIPENATFQQLADAISQIETGINTTDATATAEYILSGLTAYIDNLKVTGTMPNHGNKTYTPTDVIQSDGAGYYEAITINPRPPLSGDAEAGDVLANKTFYNSDYTKKAGAMVDRGTINHSLSINGSFTIPAGKHSGSGKVTQDIPTKAAETITPGTTNKTIGAGRYLSGAQTILGDPDLVSANILSGKNIFGVAGSAPPGKGFASGSVYYTNAKAKFKPMDGSAAYSISKVVVTGLTFKPSYILAYQSRNHDTPTVTNLVVYVYFPPDETRTFLRDSWVIFDPVYKTLRQFEANSYDAYVNATGFCFPGFGFIDYPLYWKAWE